jgi:predicted PolB exonuclease-like 3'-5' exonuclease
MRIKPTPSRRNVVIDIETISNDPNDPKGALSAISGRIVCICLLIDDGTCMKEVTIIGKEESGLLRNFWAHVQPGDVFIGFNLLNFDMLFIRQRSWILGVRPSRKIDLKKFYTGDVIDAMMLWGNWGAQKFVSLDQLAGAMGCGSKSGAGDQVAAWWQDGKLDQIAHYCMNDVRLTYLVFLKLMFQSIPERFTALANGPLAEYPSSPNPEDPSQHDDGRAGSEDIQSLIQ